MSTKYFEQSESRKFGSKLIVFKRKEGAEQNFHFRAKIDGRREYIRQTCRTNDPTQAMAFAENSFVELTIRHREGRSLKNLKVSSFFDEWLDDRKHTLTSTRFRDKKNCFDRYLVGYFGNKIVGDLTKKYCDGYWRYRLDFWDSAEGKARIELNSRRIRAKSKSSHNVAVKPAFATLKSEASLINEFLRAACDQGHLPRSIKVAAADAIPKSERGDGVRSTFTKDEYSVLTKNLYNYAKCRGRFKGVRVNELHRFQREMLRAFVLLASSTGMRVGELKQLTWGDLEEINSSETGQALLISVRGNTSKTRNARNVVAHDNHIIGVLREFRNLSKFDQNSDLIFGRQRADGQIVPVDLSTTFKEFLKKCPYKNRPQGLRMDDNGKPRPLYSLRHFYAVSRLRNHVDVYQLSVNMGTGVDQIRKHYAAHISGEAFITGLTKNLGKSNRSNSRKEIERLVEMVSDGEIKEEEAIESMRKLAERRRQNQSQK